MIRWANLYNSLMLIVLCFVTGAFARPQNTIVNSDSAVEQPVDLKSKSIAPEKERAQVQGFKVYTDLFPQGSSEVNTEVALALATVLGSHDLKAQIEVYADTADSDEGLGLSITRSINLFKYFLAKGLPAWAVTVESTPALASKQEQARVLFFNQEK